MGTKGHSVLMLLLLLMAGVWLEAKIQKIIYIHSQKLTWDEARKYCQENYIDMVTWDIIDPHVLTNWLLEENLHDVWIGLREDPEQKLAWRWINVRTGEGLTGDDVCENKNCSLGHGLSGSCASFNTKSQQWESLWCFIMNPFICYSDNLVVVNKNKTWEDAMNHCREMTTASFKYDLLSINGKSDHSYVSDRIYRATTQEVWTGLRFLGGEWWWSDRKTFYHQEMLPDCPSQWRHCGTLSKNNTDQWTTRDCSERRNFICSYEEVAELKTNV